MATNRGLFLEPEGNYPSVKWVLYDASNGRFVLRYYPVTMRWASKVESGEVRHFAEAIRIAQRIISEP